MHPAHLDHSPRYHFTVVHTPGTTPESCPKGEPWKATVAFASGNVAEQKACDLRCAGHKALVKRVSEVVDHGVPTGWEA